jgi:hypothetical protein
MKRKTGKVIFCYKCWKDWGENEPNILPVSCKRCEEIIMELKDIKSKRLSRSVKG